MELVTALLSAFGLLVSAILIVFTTWIIMITKVHAKYDHLPGPKRNSFFMGNIDVLSGARDGEEAFAPPPEYDESKPREKLKPLSVQIINKLLERYGDTIVLFVFHHAWVVTRSPIVMKSLLVEGDPHTVIKTTKTKLRELFNTRYLGDGLASARDYHGWYLRRKALDPMFHRSKLRNAMDTFNTAGDQYVTKLQGYMENGEAFKLGPILHRTTIDSVMRSMFTMDSNNLTSEFHDKSVAFANDTFGALQSAMLPFYECLPWTYSYRQKISKQILEFREIGAKMIRERITLIQSELHEVPDDILTTIVRNYLDGNGGYTFEIAVDEILTVVVAGMETTANSLSFCMMELGRRPDLVQRLVVEVDDIIGKKSYISNDDITKLPFMTSLIKETLRLYPTVSQIARDVVKPVQVDGMSIPADTTVLFNFMASNHNPEYLKQPLKFDPDRFDVSKENKVPMYSNLAFSVGPRNCIGQNFAQMEMKVMLTKFFQHFNLVLDQSECFELGARATIFPLSELKCTVTARQ